MQAITLQNEFRFGGIERLYGKGSIERLRAAHVIIVGIGGVGSGCRNRSPARPWAS